MEWQPIETAPRDGTRILAFNGFTGPFVTGWSNRYGFACHGMADDDLPAMYFPVVTH